MDSHTAPRLKCGDAREDGKVFYQYRKGRECWVTAEQLASYREKKRLRNLAPEDKAERLQRRAEYRKSARGREMGRSYLVREEVREARKNYMADYVSREEVANRRKEYAREYRTREGVKDRQRAYRQEYLSREGVKDRRLEYQRSYRSERKKSDPLFALQSRLRRRITKALLGQGFTKTSATVEILGCSFEDLYAHLESQFTEGMTWENRDEWHVDHILPLASASTEEELLKLCHYTNLQPLWAGDNLSKGAKLPDDPAQLIPSRESLFVS